MARENIMYVSMPPLECFKAFFPADVLRLIIQPSNQTYPHCAESVTETVLMQLSEQILYKKVN